MENSKLWYNKPPKNWNEALPIGNGRLGAMIFGYSERDRIQMNEDSVWYGGPRDRNNPDAYKHLQEIRSLLMDENTISFATEPNGLYVLRSE